MKRSLFLFAFVIVAATLGFGQIRVYVHHTGDDLVGERFAYAVKEQLRKSTSYVVVDSPQLITIQLVSVDDGDVNHQGLSSAISSVFTLNTTDLGNYILGHNIYIVGGNKISDVASSLVADLDRAIGETNARFEKTRSEHPD